MAVQARKRPEGWNGAGGSSYEKLAITMPSRTVEKARAEVAAGAAKSLSAFVSRAVEEKLERDEFQDVLDEIFRDRPMSTEEREWAGRLILGR